ncbi:MAG: SCO family protein [Rhodocyclaceae bacterium]
MTGARLAGVAMMAALALPVRAGIAPADPARSSFDPAIMQIDEPRYLGARLDARTALVDAGGHAFTLGDMLGKPVILLLSYYGCDGSCPTMNQNLAKALVGVERFRLGRDYRVLTVSFDKNDSAQTAARFVQKSALPVELSGGWRHAVLKMPQAETERFAGSVGFRYFWSRADRTFLHPNVLVFLTPEGRVARYLYGTSMDARNVELALIDADWGRISESAAVFDMITGACFSYNYAEGRYQPNYSLLAGVGSLAFGLSLLGLGAWAFRRKIREEGSHVH